MPELTDQQIIEKMYSYEYYDFEPTYEKDLPTDSAHDYFYTPYFSYQLIESNNPNNHVLITAPHAQSHYRHYGNYIYDCGTTPEECASNVENNADYGHDTGCCGKEPDHYTGAMARVVGEIVGAPVIYSKYKTDDPNYYDWQNTPQSPTIEPGQIPFKHGLQY